MKGSLVEAKPRPIHFELTRSQRQVLHHLILHILMPVVSIIFVAPFLWMVITSLKVSEQVFTWPPIFIPQPAKWINYYDALTFLPFGRYFLNSFLLCVVVVSGTLLSNTLIAYGFSRVDWIGRDIVFWLVLSTMMLPMQVTMIPIYIIFRKLGWVGGFLPLMVPAFFGSAYYTFLLRQFFRGIPFELSEAARIDGCSELGILRHIILPLAKPALTTIALFAFIGTWNDFLGPLIYLRDEQLYTVTLGLQQFQSRYVTPMNQLMAASTVAIIPVLVVFFLAQRMFIEGISITGMGGK
jgi:multiple sugar transport system permease protein